MTSTYKPPKVFSKNTVAFACSLALSCYATSSLAQNSSANFNQNAVIANNNALATTLTYIGDTNDLVSSPLGRPGQGIAPKEGGGYSYSNNTVTIDFTPSASGDNVPSFVFGGFVYRNLNRSTADLVSENNHILFNQGTVNGDVYGGHAYVVAGNESIATATAINNSVLLNGIQVGGSVYGGYVYANAESDKSIATATVTDNVVTINGDTKIAGSVYGGYVYAKGNVSTAAVAATVTDNRVLINGDAQVGGSIYGGYANVYANNRPTTVTPIPATVTNNSVSINGNIQVRGSVYGGSADILANASVGAVTQNSVTIDRGAKVDGNIYGGYSFIRNNLSTAADNSVTINDSTIGKSVYAGYAYSSYESATAADNRVMLTGDTTIGSSVYGGYTTAGRAAVAESNHINMNDNVRIGENVYGAQSFANGASSASINTITLNNGTQVNGNIYGGQALVMLGEDDDLDVDLKANNNTVSLNHNVSVLGNLYGGAADLQFFSTINPKISMQATHNTLSIGDNVTFSPSSNVYGGFLSSGMGNIYDNLKGHEYSFDTFTGNTLNFTAHPVVINRMANFEYYNFTIDPVLANSPIALIHANEIVLGSNDTNVTTGHITPSKVQVIGIRSGRVLMPGDRFILMNADQMSGTGEGITTQGVAQQGISLLYDVVTTVDIDNNEVIATIPGSVNPFKGGDGNGNGGGDGGGPGNAGNHGYSGGKPAARVNPRIVAISESRIAALALTIQGADLAAEQSALTCKVDEQEDGQFCAFGTMTGSTSRYNSGSHIDLNSFNMLGGIRYRLESLPNMSVGIFAEGGWGSYDSYNSFYNALPVHGKGNTRYFGVGLLGRYDFDNGLYTDASIRFGRNHNKFDTRDIQNLTTEEYARYTARSNYMSGHIGVGYILPINDTNEFDLSARYLYSTVGGKDVNIAGDNFSFERVNSHRARVNATLNHCYSNTVTLNAGLGYEHEFDGKARATTYSTYNIDAPSLRGGTGLVSIGANIKPSSNQRLSLDIKANGYTGKREGVGASIQVNYAF